MTIATNLKHQGVLLNSTRLTRRVAKKGREIEHMQELTRLQLDVLTPSFPNSVGLSALPSNSPALTIFITNAPQAALSQFAAAVLDAISILPNYGGRKR